MTLVEVMAALAILGFVLTAVLAARGRYLHQYALAQEKHQAVRIADELLADWYRSDLLPAAPSSGRVPGHNEWWWRTTVVVGRMDGLDGFHIVRISISKSNEPSAEPLTLVDLVVAEKQSASTQPRTDNASDR
jgi:type II secretory pathway pseudopilin PulG